MTPPARYRERALLLPCEGEQLLAVLAEPEAEPKAEAAGEVGVVIVVGGPQYRAGSHRLFVQLARTLAAAGFAALRFDVRGMGDSSGELPHFERLGPDIAAAIDALQAARPQTKRVVLWGLCDGASAALLYLHERPDPRVHGLCLLNPWVRSQASLARTHVKHYYRQRLMQPAFWRKLATGQVAVGALRSFWANFRAARAQPRPATGPDGFNDAAHADYQTRMARACQRFSGPMLLVLSGQDYTAREFAEFVGTHPAWHGALSRPHVQRRDIAQADHTFSTPADAQHLAQETLIWLSEGAAT